MTSVVTSQSSTSVLQPSPVLIDSVARSSPERRSVDEGDTSSLATPRTLRRGAKKSFDDLRLLAVSAQITELSYSIGELQTRIFEIQELRHRSVEPPADDPSTGRKSSDSSNSSTGVIDNALGQLDVRLETVSQTVSSITLSLEPLLSTVKTPTQSQTDDSDEAPMLLRKYGDLLTEWDSVQAEAKVLREELKEDKWLAVFRTVSEQADGMMTSLDKAVNMCQVFINQVYSQTREHQQRRPDSGVSDHLPSLASFDDLLKSYEAKKKYYMPSTTKVISVLNRGIDDRITKNGECLRKHADMQTRWDALRVKIKRVDHDMEKIRRILTEIERESSEAESVISETSINYGSSPQGRSTRAPSNSSTSTLARFAAKVSTVVGRSTPNLKQTPARLELPQQNRTISRRTSFLPFRSAQPNQESFSLRPNLFHSTGSINSTAPVVDDWVDLGNGRNTIKPNKPRWNGSTRPVAAEAPLPPVPPMPSPNRPPSAARNRPPLSRPPSSSARYGPNSKPPTTGPPPIPARSAARPQTPSRHVSHGSHVDSSPLSRPGSRAQSSFGHNGTPRARPKTPSQIPIPRFNFSSSMSQASDDAPDYMSTPLSHRTFGESPAMSPSNGGMTMTPSRRRPSASHIPIPNFGPRSRAPSPSVSPYRPLSPTSSSAAPSATSSLFRSQTPDLSPQHQSRPHHQLSASTSVLLPGNGRPTTRQAIVRGPPSSFREGPTTTPPTTRNPSSIRSPTSRPGSRADNQPSTHEGTQGPMYLPGSVHDPLDAEVARIVNSVPHGMTIERIDPPLRLAPRAGEEVKAQYAISNALGRRVLGFRLVIINRQGAESRKVMCRVGGGWMDLASYMTNRHSI